jgi:hypothetical protein
MLTPEQRSSIDRLIYEVEDREEVVRVVSEMQTAQELFAYADVYNWDDGMRIPAVIADHRLCDSATALLLFWRADAAECFGQDAPKSEYQEDWFRFCKMITVRLLNGHYRRGPNSFDPELNQYYRKILEKRGFPGWLFDPVTGTES